MSQETLNIIIGALIGFVPSALVALVIHVLNLREKRKEELRKIIVYRIDQIENMATEMMKCVSVIYLKIDNIEKNKKTIETALEAYQDFGVFLSVANNVNDMTLTKYVDEFVTGIRDFHKFIIHPNDENKSNMVDKIYQVSKYYGNVLLRLDYLRRKI